MSPKAKKQYNQMFALYDSGKYADGAECCTKLLQQYPGFADALCMLGICLYYIPVRRFLSLYKQGKLSIPRQRFEELEGGECVRALLGLDSAAPPSGTQPDQPADHSQEQQQGQGNRPEPEPQAAQLTGKQVTLVTRFLHALGWQLISDAQEAGKADTHVPYHIAALLSRTEGKSAQALAFYKKATDLFVNSSTLVRDLGFHQFLMHDYPAAEATLRRAFALTLASGKVDEQVARSQLALLVCTCFMSGNYQGCLDAIQSFVSRITSACTHGCFDHGSRSQRLAAARANGYHSCWRDVRAAECLRADVLELMSRLETEKPTQDGANGVDGSAAADSALETLTLLQSAGLSEDVRKGLANKRYDLERQSVGILRLTDKDGSQLTEPRRQGARQVYLKALHFLYRKNPANADTFEYLREEAERYGSSAKDLYLAVCTSMDATPVSPESFSEALGGMRGKDGYPEPTGQEAHRTHEDVESAGSEKDSLELSAKVLDSDRRTEFDDSSLSTVIKYVFDDFAFTGQFPRSLLRLRLAIRTEDRSCVEEEISGFISRHCSGGVTCAYGMFDVVANLIRSECGGLPQSSGKELLGQALSHLLETLVAGQATVSKCMLIRAVTELTEDPCISETARAAGSSIDVFSLLGLTVPESDADREVPAVEYSCTYKLYLNGTYTDGKKDKVALADPETARLRYRTREEYDSALAKEQRSLHRLLFSSPPAGGDDELIRVSGAELDAYTAACRYLADRGYPRTAALLSHLASSLNPEDKCLASRAARYYLEALELDSGLAMYGKFMYKSDPFANAQENQDWDFLVAVAECCIKRMSTSAEPQSDHCGQCGHCGQCSPLGLPRARDFFTAMKATYEILISAADELDDSRTLVWYAARQGDLHSYLNSYIHSKAVVLSRPELSYAIQTFLSLLLEGLECCGCMREPAGSAKDPTAPVASASSEVPEWSACLEWLEEATREGDALYAESYDRLVAGDREDSDGEKIERLADLDPYLTRFFKRLLTLASTSLPAEGEPACDSTARGRMFDSEDSDRRLTMVLGEYGDYLLGPATPLPGFLADDMRGLGQFCKILSLSLGGKVLLAINQARSASLCGGKHTLVYAFALKGLEKAPAVLRNASADALRGF